MGGRKETDGERGGERERLRESDRFRGRHKLILEKVRHLGDGLPIRRKNQGTHFQLRLKAQSQAEEMKTHIRH
eukprot:1330541-Amorphochlora_amoeboformis.AAC.2